MIEINAMQYKVIHRFISLNEYNFLQDVAKKLTIEKIIKEMILLRHSRKSTPPELR